MRYPRNTVGRITDPALVRRFDYLGRLSEHFRTRVYTPVEVRKAVFRAGVEYGDSYIYVKLRRIGLTTSVPADIKMSAASAEGVNLTGRRVVDVVYKEEDALTAAEKLARELRMQPKDARKFVQRLRARLRAIYDGLEPVETASRKQHRSGQTAASRTLPVSMQYPR